MQKTSAERSRYAKDDKKPSNIAGKVPVRRQRRNKNIDYVSKAIDSSRTCHKPKNIGPMPRIADESVRERNKRGKFDIRNIHGTTRKAELLEKRHNLCLGTKFQPIWESRSLKINPVLTDDLNRFLSNAQHTQRWAFTHQCLYIIWNNIKRLPFLWPILMIFIELMAPYVLRSGTPKISWHGAGGVLLVSLFISLSTSMLEASRRYLIGRCIDDKRCNILQGRRARIKAVRVCDLAVGNIVKLASDEEVPTDLILLACSNPDGQVHIDTSFLDGSNNLKVKSCVKDVKVEASIHSFANIRGQIVCDKPSPDMESFSGTLKLKGHPRSSIVTIKNFVMKGSIIRNTACVYGVVTHTGPDTKIAQNVKDLQKPIKMGTFENDINQFTVIVSMLYLLCLLVSVGTRWVHLINIEDKKRKFDTLPTDSLLFVAIRFIILYGGLVPITLPAIVDLLRYLFCIFYDGYYSAGANNSEKHDETKEQGSTILANGNSGEFKSESEPSPLSWSLNSGLYEELGMVDFVFTDKTGTLTTKRLSISLITVGKKSYRFSGDIGKLKEEIDVDFPGNERLDMFLKLMCLCNASVPVTNFPHLDTFGCPIDTNGWSSSGFKHSGSSTSEVSYKEQNEASPLKPSKSKIHFGDVSFIEPTSRSVSKNFSQGDTSSEEFEFNERSSSSEGIQFRSGLDVQFKATSREDECMSDMARDLGYRLLTRSKSSIHFDARGTLESWTILGINDFTSTRGRMSIVLRQNYDHDGSILFVKGSAEAMLDLLSPDEPMKEIAILKSRLGKLTSSGFRVLLCAYKEMDHEETVSYQRQYMDAEESIYSEEERFEAAAIYVENKLHYLGLVAFKDEIQQGVPDTLDLLMGAGVRVWMLTGDNRYLSVQTAYLSRLLIHPCRVFSAKLGDNTEEESIIRNGTALYDLFLQERMDRIAGEQLCLLIDGDDLRKFLAIPDMQTCLINMACFADIVIACRLSPDQKAELVKMVKVRLEPTPITLAIGDGMNDIKMMQEAHIGVGIIGSENHHAVAYADFAVTCFAALRDLLFLRGNRSIQALSTVVYWSFFKCLCLVMPVFYYQGSTDWVGLDLYGSFIQILFHLLFTGLPVILSALLERRLPDSALTDLPVLYTLCRRRYHVNLLRLCFWMLEGVLSSLFCYLSLQSVVMESPIFSGGGTLSARSFGLLSSLGALLMCNVRLLIEFSSRNKLAGNLLSMGFVFGLPPLFLSLTYACGGRALRAATVQVVLWQPIYFLIPVWITASIVSYVISALMQAVVTPNLGNYLGHWFMRQSCTCTNCKGKFKENEDSSTNELLMDKETWSKGSKITETMSGSLSKYEDTNPESTPRKNLMDLTEKCHTLESGSRMETKAQCETGEGSLKVWCECLSEKAKMEFSANGVGWVTRMIPSARPFRVRKTETHVEGSLMTDVSSVIDKLGSEDKDVNESTSGAPINQRVSYLIDRLTLRFKDMQLEADYLLDKRRSHYYANCSWYRTVFISLGIFYFANWMLEFSLKRYWGQSATLYSVIPTVIVVVVSFFCTLLTLNPFVFFKYINGALGSLVACMILQHIVTEGVLNQVNWLQPVLFPIVTFVILHITFVYAVLCNVIFIIASVSNIGTLLHCIPLFIGINVFVAFVGYRLEYNSRKSFLLEFSVASARKKQNELLNTMLPNFVVSRMINARLNEDGIPIGFEAEEHSTVSVLFCDVYNFQELVASIEPTRLVELLDSLFLAFDRCAEQFGATKIETVSETYLAALGLSRGFEQCPLESAANAIDMALAMLEVANQIRYPVMGKTESRASISTSSYTAPSFSRGSGTEVLESLSVKIGINSGRVISGLVGAKKPQYALFGDTVNTASRMKATGEAGYIHITESTYDLVKSDGTLSFHHRETFVKGKGLMSTYLLSSVLGSSYPNFNQTEVIQEVELFRKDRDSTDTSIVGRVCSKYIEDFMDLDVDSFMGQNLIGVPIMELKGKYILEPMGNVSQLKESDDNRHSQESQKSDSAVLFECLDRSHNLNAITMKDTEELTRGDSMSQTGVVTLHTSDFERIRIRKLRISAAVGALTEDDILIGEQPALVRGFTSYSAPDNNSNMTISSSLTKTSRCLKFTKRKKTLPFQSEATSVLLSRGSEIFMKQSKCKNGSSGKHEHSSKIDAGEMHMKTHEWLLLRFADKLQEDRYRSHFYHNKTNIDTIEHALVIFLVAFVSQSVLAIAMPRAFVDSNKVEHLILLNYVPYWTVRSVYTMSTFVLWFLFHYRSFSRRSESTTTRWLTFFLNLLFVSAACVFALSNSWAVFRGGSHSDALNLWLPFDSVEFYFYIVVLHHNSGIMFQTCLLVDILFVIMSITFISSSVVRTPTTITTLFGIPCYIIFNLISAHCREAIDRRTFFANEKARMVEARVGQMLNEMLPKRVLEEFQADKLRMSYCHEKMSFLFSDIVGFTSWANSVDASDVIALLQKLFARFDKNSTKFGLYKLCTIGDAYVAVSEPAIETTCDSVAIRNIEGVLQMAYSMLHTIKEVADTFKIPGLNMRIGLHYGNSVGGVIGSGRLRYDLWGIDIYTANLMESTGVPGKICVSERLRGILQESFPNRFTFKLNTQVQVIDDVVQSYILSRDANDHTTTL